MQELRTVTCQHEGVGLQGLMAAPSTPGPHPAVMVMHTALGLGEHMRRQTRLLARLGYVAVATDMYGGGIYHTNPADAATTFSVLLENPALLRARTVAWHARVRGMKEVDPNRTAAIGYCFGGRCVLELARSGADLRAAVSYHGLLETHQPAQRGTIQAVVAVYTGAKDPYAPPAHVAALCQELTGAEARWQLTIFGDAAHGFTDPDAGKQQRPGIAYDALAERLSWAGTLTLLQAQLGTSSR